MFKGAIGRIDFTRGDHSTLIKAIRENLFLLGNKVRFTPEHGLMSTFSKERLNNHFVSDNA